MNMRRFLAYLLSVAMLLSLCVVTAGAEEDTNEARVGETEYASLLLAVAAAAPGDTVVLLKDVSLSETLSIEQSVTIQGDGHTITSTATRGIWVAASDVSLTLNNLTLDGSNKNQRGVQVNVDMTNVTLNITGCTIKNVTHYALNICNGTSVNVTISNSTLAAWCAVNAWSAGYTIDISDSILSGINDKGYNSAGGNDFGVIVLEGDSTLASDMAASNNTVTLNNCDIIAGSLNGNQQHTVLFNASSGDGATDNRVSITGGTITGFTDVVVLDNGTGNTTTIDETVIEAGADTFASAISAAALGDDNTVRLGESFASGDSKFVFSSGETTLDLNGKTVTTTADPFLTVSPDAHLTIVDSGENGTLYEKRDYSYLLLNKGTLTIEGGSFKAESVEYFEGENEFYGAFALAMASGSRTTVNGGAFTGAIYTNGTSENVLVDFQGGVFHDMLYLAARSLTVNVADGTFLGGVEFKGSAVNVSGGTFHGADIDPVHAANGNGSSTNGAWAFAVVDNAGYGVVTANISGGSFDGKVELLDDDADAANNNDTLSLTGGRFTMDPTDYAAAGKYAKEISETADGVTYLYQVSDVPEATEVKVTPSVSTAATGSTEDKPETVATAMGDAAAAINETAPTVSGLNSAAAAAAQQNTTTTSAAAEALTEALGDTVAAESVTLFVQPYLDITVKDAAVDAETPTSIKELTLSIKPMVKTVAATTTAASKIQTAGDGKNAVEIAGSAREVEVVEPVSITFQLPSGFAATAGSKLSIRHEKENGAIYYYEATVSQSSGKLFATFVVTHGFSDFTVKAQDTRECTVHFDSSVGDKLFRVTDVGSVLPSLPAGRSTAPSIPS